MRAIDRHTPVRSCLGCRQRKGWRDLVRLTRGHAGSRHAGSRHAGSRHAASGHIGSPTVIEIDGPSRGRGAWLCRSETGGVELACLELAIAQNQFARAWRSTVTSDDVAALRDAT